MPTRAPAVSSAPAAARRSPSTRCISRASSASATRRSDRARRTSSAEAATSAACAQRRGCVVGGQRGVEPARALGEVAARHPNATAPPPGAGASRVVAQRRGQRGAQVVVLELRALEARSPATSGSAASATARYQRRAAPRGVRSRPRRPGARGVLADRLEQPVAVLAASSSATTSDLSTRRPSRSSTSPSQAGAAAHRLDRLQPERPGEHGEAAEEHPLLGGRAGRGSSQRRPSVCWRVSARVRRRAGQASRSAARRSAPAPARRRGRPPARSRAACRRGGGRSRPRRRRSRRSSWKPGAASAARSTNSRTASKRSSSWPGAAVGIRQRERRHAQDDLAGDAQRLPAGRQHRELGQPRSSCSARRAQAPSRCSQLSSTSSSRRSPMSRARTDRRRGASPAACRAPAPAPGHERRVGQRGAAPPATRRRRTAAAARPRPRAPGASCRRRPGRSA